MEPQNEKQLSSIQCKILIGILLGDASLSTSNNGKTYRLRILQSEAHKNYVFHLYDVFKEFTITPPKKYCFEDLRNPGKVYSRWYFNTVAYSFFAEYAQLFYRDKIKQLPPLLELDKRLTPRSIAYWYIDDGSLKWKNRSLGVRFCTDNFTKEEVMVLANLLQEKYQLKTSLQRKGKNFRIYITSYSYVILKGLILDFLEPCMLYKFPDNSTANTPFAMIPQQIPDL